VQDFLQIPVQDFSQPDAPPVTQPAALKHFHEYNTDIKDLIT